MPMARKPEIVHAFQRLEADCREKRLIEIVAANPGQAVQKLSKIRWGRESSAFQGHFGRMCKRRARFLRTKPSKIRGELFYSGLLVRSELDEFGDRQLVSWSLSSAAHDAFTQLGYISKRRVQKRQYSQDGIPARNSSATEIKEGLKAVKRQIRERRGQAAFRKNLLLFYKRCAISECTATDVLEAAHIVPIASRVVGDIRNGLLLRADIHTLFDLHLLSIEPETMCVRIDHRLRGTEYQRYEGRKLRVPITPSQRPGTKYLRDHYARHRALQRQVSA
jgi:hypothetical protein